MSPSVRRSSRASESGSWARRETRAVPTSTSRCASEEPQSTRCRRSLPTLAEAAVESVDEVRHALEALCDHADPVLEEVLRLDVERLGKRSHYIARRHGPVAVHEMVEVARGEARLGRESSVGDPGLLHEPDDGRAERLLAEASLLRHQITTS